MSVPFPGTNRLSLGFGTSENPCNFSLLQFRSFTGLHSGRNAPKPISPHFLPTHLPMASITPHGERWRAQVYVKGVRESRIFRTKREAASWAAIRETQLRADAETPAVEKYTLADAMRRYEREISPLHRGRRWEIIRIDALLRQEAFPGSSLLCSLGPEHFAIWRDARVRQVSSGAVLREISLLSGILETARREWRWIAENPIHDLRKPRSPPHRDRVISRGEIRALLRAMNWIPGPCKSSTSAVSRAFMLALRTGMRAGEISALRWAQVTSVGLVAVGTKTDARDIPLTPQARRVIESMRGWDTNLVFGLSRQTLDALFRRYREKAGLSGFTFHDSRHTAATWLAQRIDVLDLCKMFGWRNPKMAMTYYNPTAADIASRITRRGGTAGGRSR